MMNLKKNFLSYLVYSILIIPILFTLACSGANSTSPKGDSYFSQPTPTQDCSETKTCPSGFVCVDNVCNLYIRSNYLNEVV